MAVMGLLGGAADEVRFCPGSTDRERGGRPPDGSGEGPGLEAIERHETPTRNRTVVSVSQQTEKFSHRAAKSGRHTRRLFSGRTVTGFDFWEKLGWLRCVGGLFRPATPTKRARRVV